MVLDHFDNITVQSTGIRHELLSYKSVVMITNSMYAVTCEI